jgi:hypothetical protein
MIAEVLLPKSGLETSGKDISEVYDEEKQGEFGFPESSLTIVYHPFIIARRVNLPIIGGSLLDSRKSCSRQNSGHTPKVPHESESPTPSITPARSIVLVTCLRTLISSLQSLYTETSTFSTGQDMRRKLLPKGNASLIYG